MVMDKIVLNCLGQFNKSHLKYGRKYVEKLLRSKGLNAITFTSIFLKAGTAVSSMASLYLTFSVRQIATQTFMTVTRLA